MKKSQILVLLALAGSSAAFAAPRESVTFTTVASNGLQGSALNAEQTASFTGSDGGGAYNATYLTISGQYTVNVATASYGSEATILVTPPSGSPFMIIPMNFGAFPAGQPTHTLPADRYTVPVSAIGTAGQWSFRFLESFNDGGDTVDGTWDSITITLNDGPVPAAPTVSGPNSLALTNVACDGLAAAPGFSTNITVPGGTNFLGFKVNGAATAVNCSPTANLAVNATPLTNARVRVTPPGGTAVVCQLWGNNTISTATGELLVSLPAANNAAGNWLIEAYMTADNPGVDVVFNSLGVELIDTVTPPVATNLGAVTVAAPLSGTATLAASQTKWFKFTLNSVIDANTNRGLQIDTEGSTTVDGTGALNTSIGLYSATGARIATDFPDGTQSLGTLTFGVDNSPAPGDGLAYNGRDGANLAVGDYYVAVTAGDTGVAYQPGFFGVTNTSTQTGDVMLNVRLVENVVTPPTATDLGVIGSTPVTTTLNFAGPGEIQWLKFTTLAGCDPVTNFLDIDTEGSLLTGTGTNPNDTEIGLYRFAGSLIASDDDSGSGALSQLSFGATGSPRPAVGNGLAYTGTDGTNGTLVIAGTYYLAVGVYNVNFNAAFGAVHTDSAITTGSNGPINVNFNSNLPGGGPLCGLADLGGVGGIPGADNHLDNNDFVVFIDFFFNHNPLADQGGVGGAPGADGVWDNNDFVVFIDNFFTAPASCR